MTITEKLQNNRASFSRRAQEIRADWTLSDAAKRQELEGLYTEARSTHEQLTSQYRKDLSERLQKTRSEAFAAPRVGKDPALDVLVYRGALDRISKTRDTLANSHTLERARMTVDGPWRRRFSSVDTRYSLRPPTTKP